MKTIQSSENIFIQKFIFTRASVIKTKAYWMNWTAHRNTFHIRENKWVKERRKIKRKRRKESSQPKLHRWIKMCIAWWLLFNSIDDRPFPHTVNKSINFQKHALKMHTIYQLLAGWRLKAQCVWRCYAIAMIAVCAKFKRCLEQQNARCAVCTEHTINV